MNERDALRFAARRSALLQSLRGGDAIGAARAGARTRLPDAVIATAEFAAAREARRRVGRAIVRARMPKVRPRPPRYEEAITGDPPSRRKWWAAAAVVALVVLALIFFGTGVGLNGGGAPPVATAIEVQRTALLTVSRGRTVAAPEEVVAVQESPTPAPTAASTASPEATASAAATTGSGTGAPGTGGTGTGTGTGSGSGSGPGSGTGLAPTPTPAPTRTPSVPPPGFSRLNVLVLDSRTRRPIPDVCVVIGTQNCGPNAPHTDANGRWSADVAASSASTYWDLGFIKDPYITQFRKITLPGGRSQTYTIYLQKPRGSG